MLLTDQLVLQFQRCRRQAYLDQYGDPTERGSTSDFILKLGQDRQRLKRSLLTEHHPVEPDYHHRDWEDGFQKTFTLMQMGTPMIENGVLMSSKKPNTTLVSTPDLLIKRSGVSVFGPWEYIAVDIKLSKRPKQEYQLLSAYHTEVLSQVQQSHPEVAWLYLREKGWYVVDLPRVTPKLAEILTSLAAMLQEQLEPEVFIARSRCNLCPWFDHCYDIAQEQNHLSLLPGVTPSRYPVLKQHQILSVEAIADSDPQRLHSQTGLGQDITQKIVYQARAVVRDSAILLPHAQQHLDLTAIAPQPIELYFDIEAEPSLNLMYLHGVLVVNRQDNSQQFYPFLARSPEEERDAWLGLVELLWRYPNAPIYHFCPYEVQSVKRLGERYRTPYSVIEPLLPRFIDLHEWVTRTAALPIESYTLKLIARWLGFQWQNSSANGAQAIYWYSLWLESGDERHLDEIMRYNEDDCRATYHIKEWLQQFLAQVHQPLAVGF